MNRKSYLLIIGGLIVLIVVLSIIVNRFRVIPSEEEEAQLTPTEIPGPTITPVKINYTFPTLVPELQAEFRYPFKYENMTIEYKSRSGTFLIYYQGDLTLATESTDRFFSESNLNMSQYRVEYRTLDPISLPPRVEADNP